MHFLWPVSFMVSVCVTPTLPQMIFINAPPTYLYMNLIPHPYLQIWTLSHLSVPYLINFMPAFP